MGHIGKLVIFTLGDQTEQMRKIANLGLLDFPVEIFTHKDENMFRYLMAKYPSQKYVMIGDSVKRDILPAQQAGIPHLFHVSKLSDEGNPDQGNSVIKISQLNQFLLDKIKEISGQ